MTDILDDKAEIRALMEAEAAKRKKVKKIALGAIAVVAFLTWFLMQPLTAGPEYGICRTYLETYIRYPSTFKITQYDVFGPSIRIFYTYIDPFGGQRSEMIECVAIPDPVNGYVMKQLKINRQEINAERLRIFNLAIPGIIAHKPSLIIPYPPGDNLMDLKRD